MAHDMTGSSGGLARKPIQVDTVAVHDDAPGLTAIAALADLQGEVAALARKLGKLARRFGREQALIQRGATPDGIDATVAASAGYAMADLLLIRQSLDGTLARLRERADARRPKPAAPGTPST